MNAPQDMQAIVVSNNRVVENKMRFETRKASRPGFSLSVCIGLVDTQYSVVSTRKEQFRRSKVSIQRAASQLIVRQNIKQPKPRHIYPKCLPALWVVWYSFVKFLTNSCLSFVLGQSAISTHFIVALLLLQSSKIHLLRDNHAGSILQG